MLLLASSVITSNKSEVDMFLRIAMPQVLASYSTAGSLGGLMRGAHVLRMVKFMHMISEPPLCCCSHVVHQAAPVTLNWAIISRPSAARSLRTASSYPLSGSMASPHERELQGFGFNILPLQRLVAEWLTWFAGGFLSPPLLKIFTHSPIYLPKRIIEFFRHCFIEFPIFWKFESYKKKV